MKSLQEVGISETDLVKFGCNFLKELINSLAIFGSVSEYIGLHSEFVICSKELNVHVFLGSAKIQVLKL